MASSMFDESLQRKKLDSLFGKFEGIKHMILSPKLQNELVGVVYRPMTPPLVSPSSKNEEKLNSAKFESNSTKIHPNSTQIQSNSSKIQPNSSKTEPTSSKIEPNSTKILPNPLKIEPDSLKILHKRPKILKKEFPPVNVNERIISVEKLPDVVQDKKSIEKILITKEKTKTSSRPPLPKIKIPDPINISDVSPKISINSLVVLPTISDIKSNVSESKSNAKSIISKVKNMFDSSIITPVKEDPFAESTLINEKHDSNKNESQLEFLNLISKSTLPDTKPSTKQKTVKVNQKMKKLMQIEAELEQRRKITTKKNEDSKKLTNIIEKNNILDVKRYVKIASNDEKPAKIDDISTRNDDVILPPLDFVNGEPRLICRLPLMLICNVSETSTKLSSPDDLDVKNSPDESTSGVYSTSTTSNNEISSSSNENFVDSSLTTLIADSIDDDAFDMPIFDFGVENAIGGTPDENHLNEIPTSTSTPQTKIVSKTKEDSKKTGPNFKRKISDMILQSKRMKLDDEQILMSLAPSQPFVLDEKILDPNIYLAMATKMTRLAVDQDQIVRMILRVEASVYWFLSGYLFYKQSGRPYELYKMAFNQLAERDKEPLQDERLTLCVVRKLEYLKTVLHALLSFRLYSPNQKSVQKNFKAFNEYHNRPIDKTTNGIPTDFVAIPFRMEQLYKKQIHLLHSLLLAHRCWDLAETRRSPLDSEFFFHLDRVCGRLSLSMDVHSACVYLLTALNWLKIYYEANKRL